MYTLIIITFNIDIINNFNGFFSYVCDSAVDTEEYQHIFEHVSDQIRRAPTNNLMRSGGG